MTPFFNKRQNDLNFKLKILAEAEAVKNNREIAREYGISSQWFTNGKTNSICCLMAS